MFNTTYRIINNKTESEDIMQEAFLSAFRNLSSYSGEVSFGAWLKRIVINKSLDHLKKKKEIIVSLEDAGEFPLEDPNEQISEPENIHAEIIRKCVQKLPEGYRVITSLYLIEGYDHEEISQIMNISPSTSRSQLLRAKKRLSQMLAKENLKTISQS